YARLFGAYILAVGAAADGNQHPVVNLRFDCIITLELNINTFLASFKFAHLGGEHDLLEALFHTLMQWADEVAVAAGYQSVHEFDNADLATECIVYRAHFQPDDAAADNQHTFWNVRQFQSAGGIHDA